ncbi:Uncharacterized protein OBRU01_23861 [Operophtera brumata]|uniref:Uncharacterized protein n=1 Tax=Operophtera brumata TaxID=104452 RepID=A0A0L7KNN0_OPEBR|nr:Uncharacterized protein OBRU01_23861 [Operophtera brumata]
MNPYNSKFIVNALTEYQHPQYINSINNCFAQVKWRVYRCQISTKQEVCCCSCNSDAMFEVMKSLYDCYKKKDCDYCNCILCGHLPKEERKLGELRKSGTALPTVGTETKKGKAAVQKTQATMGVALEGAIPSGGFLISLEGKTPEQTETILKCIAAAGIPLPVGKTPSEKKLIDKVRKETGHPPVPKPSAEKKKSQKAIGIITPIQGKPKPEKEITEATAGAPVVKVSKQTLDKLRKAKAAGLLTPLAGKSTEEKEKILMGLAKHGLPMPEGKTTSEKVIIDKVRKDLGMPPHPKTPSMKVKYEKAQAQGLMTPLKDKSPSQKEKILKAQAAAGIPLPEAKTPSEKALIAKVTAATGAPAVGKIPSEKIRKAKAAGLLTPLAGKTTEQREQIVKGLAQQGMPLPEGKTASEKQIIEKVRKDLGMPPAKAAGVQTPLTGKSPEQKEKILKDLAKDGAPLPEGKTASEKKIIEKVRKDLGMPPGKAAGVQTPLTGKSPEQKEKILKELAKDGAPLPEGKTASEKKIIEKVRKDLGMPPGKAAGVQTPLKGKSAEQKEKILKDLAKGGAPLPEGKTASEKKIIEKVRKDMGMPPEPKTSSMRVKHAKAQAQGLMTPLEGKSPSRKEKILKAQAEAGLPLPEGRTPSEKALIAKVTAATGAPAVEKIPSEKLRKAKAAGLMTPLAGKTLEQREKIVKGLAQQGMALPVGKTTSEKMIIEKVRKDLGMPPEPKTSSMRVKHAKAQAQGLMTPLEGKSPSRKEKILKAQAEAGVPLPEGRTPSEKALIAKVTAATGAPAVGKIPSEKLRKAKAAGLMTPLAGKTAEQREKIVKGLAQQGMPLPVGKTTSEKKIIEKVRKDLGMPPEPKPSSMRAKEKPAGVMSPLAGKAIKTKSKTKTRKVGSGIAKAGIVEEFEDIHKTTTCDRGCGCDKKKIRFKHSYVKIRVTSPDISSLCPCPDECIPGVKGGVLVDSEGIKVTVGSAVGFPSFSTVNESKNSKNGKTSYNNEISKLTNSLEIKTTPLYETCPISDMIYGTDDFKIPSQILYINSNYSNGSLSTSGEPSFIYKENMQNSLANELEMKPDTSISTYLIACSESHSSSTSDFPIILQGAPCNMTSQSSSNSAIFKTEISLKFPIKSNASIGSLSIIPSHNSSTTSTSIHHLYDSLSSIHSEDTEYFTNVIDYCAVDSRSRYNHFHE